jgi:hypothetical protein
MVVTVEGEAKLDARVSHASFDMVTIIMVPSTPSESEQTKTERIV